MRALVLSGGGSKGSFQVGVLRQLFEKENISYDIIAGNSVGALNGAVLASDDIKNSLPKLEDIWLKQIKGNSSIWYHRLIYYFLSSLFVSFLLFNISIVLAIFNLNTFIILSILALAIGSLYLPYYFITKFNSIYTNYPLRKLINKNINAEKLKKSKIKILVGATCYETGEYKIVSNNDDIVNWIIASSSFPIFFSPRKIDNLHWIDGGVKDIAPLYEILKYNPTDIDIILTEPLKSSYDNRFGVFNQLDRTIHFLTNEILRNDLMICQLKFKNKINIRIFKPEKRFSNSVLDFNKKHIVHAYNTGIKHILA